MKRFFLFPAFLSLFLSFFLNSFSNSNISLAVEPDWSEGVSIRQPRSNIYEWNSDLFNAVNQRGRLHGLNYLIEVTSLLAPYDALKHLIEDGSRFNLIADFVRLTLGTAYRIHSMDDLDSWLGLHEYPLETETGIYQVPHEGDRRPNYRMGVTFVDRYGKKGLTYGCASCHASELFGKKVLGLTNRFPRATEFFVLGKKAASLVNADTFQLVTHADAGDVKLFKELKNTVPFIESRKPSVLGLDTSLELVALALSRRAQDEVATRDIHFANHPREEILRTMTAESKPAVWWNTKYKNRWLADGSVVSGNPIYTNFLWNEMGRGQDLMVLEKWLDENKSVIDELTTAVFASEAPKFTDFFSANDFDLESAKRGEVIFQNRCEKCHGSYDKGWNDPSASSMTKDDLLKTTLVTYFEKTPVIEVGTDPNRYLGMKSLEALNNLRISKKNGVLVKAQKGYVPPPLVGIWARWPYFHNNSAPSLCAVLSKASERPKSYYAGEAIDRNKDFDEECNGYPTLEKVPSEWKRNKEAYFDSNKDGLHNLGHDEGIFIKNGVELLSREDKKDLIRFLQTL